MIEIILNANSVEGYVRQIQEHLGGTLTERYGEYILEMDNEIIKGHIRLITFDWGVSLTEHDYTCSEDILFASDTSKFNPIHFIYCSKGSIYQRFNHETEFDHVKEFHSSILTSKKSVKHFALFPKGQPLQINVISIVRKDFLKKRLSSVEQLNEKLYQVFIDNEEHKGFSYYSPIHIQMDDHVKALRDIDTIGMTRILQIEGKIYHLLSMHLAIHDKYYSNDAIPESLLKAELKIIKIYAQKIHDDSSINYSLDKLSDDSGLSQAKLQSGFKFLYLRTVTEYIREVRVEAARALMSNSDLNISQIVYAIGFTSRSYFSKIFKEKYGISPNEYKKQIVSTVEEKLEK
ncbi:MAG: helix-turn-helix transcriptional regulator [Aquaticitalea sp.]